MDSPNITKNMAKEKNLGQNLKKLNQIAEWFENQEEVDVEEGLEKIKEAAKIIKETKKSFEEVENEFEEIKKDIEKD
jgi:exonuclease VII small subunit